MRDRIRKFVPIFFHTLMDRPQILKRADHPQIRRRKPAREQKAFLRRLSPFLIKHSESLVFGEDLAIEPP